MLHDDAARECHAETSDKAWCSERNRVSREWMLVFGLLSCKTV